MARTCGVFSEENESGADPFCVTVACLDFSLPGEVPDPNREPNLAEQLSRILAHSFREPASESATDCLKFEDVVWQIAI